MFAKKPFKFTLQLLIALLTISLLLSACTSTASPTPQPDPTAATAPAATAEPTTAHEVPTATAVSPTDDLLNISLDTNDMATGFQTETIAAVPASDNAPYWEVLPAYTRVTLEGYLISNHLMQPQIFIYPVEELRTVNEDADQIVASLQTLIQSPQEITPMPFLPLFNAAQVMHAHVQYLDFKNGQGLRYLSEFDQGIVPINNFELIYTYQGLSSDGTYYVAAVLPVHHPSLPDDATVTGNEPPEFSGDFPTYVTNVVTALNPQSGNTFTPDLTQLDALMSSLEIK